jgi:hypothetical protein
MAVTSRMMSSGMFRRVALVSTDVSEEISASFIKVTRIGELGTTLALTSNRRRLMKEALSFSETSVLTRATRRTSHKTAFFIVTVMKASNLTSETEGFAKSK